MNSVTTKLVTPTRLRQLLECYGSSSSSWPEDERQAALSLLKASPELITYRDQIRLLDKHLEQIQLQENNTMDQHAMQSLQQRIMNQLPDQESTASNDSVLHIKNPDEYTNEQSTKRNVSQSGHAHQAYRSRVCMGSIAASLFIVSLSAGVIHLLFSPAHDSTNQQTGYIVGNDIDNGFAQWAWEDITGESLTVDADNEPTTLLAMMELEFPAE